MKLSVYHTPEEVPEGTLPDCAIAIDVLRATSTMAAALNVGAAAIHVFSDLELLRKASEQFPSEKRLLAGEREGAKVEGFDLGNSPLDHTAERSKGRHLFMSTTNGTRCLQRIQTAPVVITAALTTRQAVVDFLLKHEPDQVWLVGSGWQGAYSLEDTVCAGAIAHQLAAQLTHDLKEIAGNDSTVAAVSLYTHWKASMLELMHCASHGQRLLRLHQEDDLKYCAQLDVLNLVPIQSEPGVLVLDQAN
ncbi:2-phosphosulfolactate phosphatase family protein [Oscillatoria sp. CS-180]|uniref:2-phosphosulfolactate phosphatase family protein n=1 Tax=Oscillatoria sp. CS-180 TaxID=3021720 RepID=UPI00232CA70C|nr:2-phosphosulfolactate phosphatase family protein [Oscillatoria sp. CS-180]MDB9527558.1 2-phosphosulfolactate phosphatase family protein [Oscillatoria sp. CS-180]